MIPGLLAQEALKPVYCAFYLVCSIQCLIGLIGRIIDLVNRVSCIRGP